MTGLIIAFGHVARSGKDLAASALTAVGRDAATRRFRRISFAGKLYELTLKVDPYVGEKIVGFPVPRISDVTQNGKSWDHAKGEYPEIRRTLEALGQGAREVFGESFWIERALADIAPTDRVVVTDLRYPNEAEAIRALGGKVVKIHRPGYEPKVPSDFWMGDWDDWDAVIENDANTKSLLDKVRTLADGWLNMPPETVPPEEAYDEDGLSMMLYQQHICSPWPVEVTGGVVLT